MRRLILAAGLLASISTSAFADRIDGGWCNEDGSKRLHISGSQIELPSGRTITGNYGRHAFSYEGPARDPEEGQSIEMRQLSEEEMILYRSTNPGKSENWTRCQAIS